MRIPINELGLVAAFPRLTKDEISAVLARFVPAGCTNVMGDVADVERYLLERRQLQRTDHFDSASTTIDLPNEPCECACLIAGRDEQGRLRTDASQCTCERMVGLRAEPSGPKRVAVPCSPDQRNDAADDPVGAARAKQMAWARDAWRQTDVTPTARTDVRDDDPVTAARRLRDERMAAMGRG